MLFYRSNEECNQKLQKLPDFVFDKYNLGWELPDNLRPSQFCADNNLDSKVRTCPGDSGGPAIVREYVHGRDQFTIIGITSGGLGGRTCEENYGVPDWYTYVAHYEVIQEYKPITVKETNRRLII